MKNNTARERHLTSADSVAQRAAARSSSASSAGSSRPASCCSARLAPRLIGSWPTGNSSRPGFSYGELGGDAGGVRISSVGVAFSAMDHPTSSAASSSPCATSRRAWDCGRLPTEGGYVAASTRWVSSADSSTFLFLRGKQFCSIKKQFRIQRKPKGSQPNFAYPLLWRAMKDSFNGVVGET